MRRNTDRKNCADRFVFTHIGYPGESHAVKIGIESLRSAPNLKMETGRLRVHSCFSAAAGSVRTGIQNDNAQLHFIDFPVPVRIQLGKINIRITCAENLGNGPLRVAGSGRMRYVHRDLDNAVGHLGVFRHDIEFDRHEPKRTHRKLVIVIGQRVSVAEIQIVVIGNRGTRPLFAVIRLCLVAVKLIRLVFVDSVSIGVKIREDNEKRNFFCFRYGRSLNFDCIFDFFKRQTNLLRRSGARRRHLGGCRRFA